MEISELEPLLSLIQRLPSLPPISSIVDLMARAGEIFGKETDKTKSKRALLSRFTKEEEINFDKFHDLLNEVYSGWHIRMTGLGSHWLDPSRWNQVIGAYSEMVRNLSVLGVKNNTIGTFILGTVSEWFATSLFRWVKSEKMPIPSLYQRNLLWWLPRNDSSNPYALIFKNLKTHSGISGKGYYQFSKTLLPSDVNKEEVDERIKQITTWSTGEVQPEWITLQRHIEQPLRDSGKDGLSLEFRENCLAARFGIALMEWGKDLDSWNPEEIIHAAMKRKLDTLARGESDMEFIPSPRFMTNTEEYFQINVQYRFWEGIQDQDEKKMAYETTLSVADMVDAIEANCTNEGLKVINTQELYELNNSLRYRLGPGYAVFENILYEEAQKDRNKDLIKRLHAQRLYENMVLTPFSRSRAWYSRQKGLKEGTHQAIPTIDPKAARAWASNYRKDRINEWRVWGNYRRTRLMMACCYADSLLVQKLIEDGADLSLISEPKGNESGDGASALLLAIQQIQGVFRFHAQINKTNENAREIAFYILEYTQQHCPSVNSATRIQNLTPLSIAIEAADPQIVTELVKKKAALEIESGGDELTPLYIAIGRYLLSALYQQRGDTGFLQWLVENNPDLNAVRMAIPMTFLPEASGHIAVSNLLESLPPAIWDLIPDVVKSVLSEDTECPQRLKDIITILLDAGADFDRLQSNGRYPLDLADEVERETGDSSIRQLLEARGAQKRAI